MSKHTGLRHLSTPDLIAEWDRLVAAETARNLSPALVRVDSELARRALDTNDPDALRWMDTDERA